MIQKPPAQKGLVLSSCKIDPLLCLSRVWKGTATTRLQGGLRGCNKHLALGGVVTKPVVSVYIETSQETDFKNCMFKHTLPEKQSEQKK